MTLKIFRRGSARCLGLLSAFATILLCLYYISMGQSSSSSSAGTASSSAISSGRAAAELGGSQEQQHQQKRNHDPMYSNRAGFIEQGTCQRLVIADTEITTMAEFSKFEFQPDWMNTREFWDKSFEEKYENLMKNSSRPPLKVIIVPHSHNDPGWLRTFINYFESDSKTILNHIVTKLQEYEDMTFIWSEISILQLWWDQAHPSKQRALKKLVDSGRLEITTGGWVMTDEANAHYYAMVDQLIEGHQWLKANLNCTPRVGWSIDPFGHGSTVPHLLAESDFDGTIIQRIHYAWKQWLAQRQAGDFHWRPYWQPPQPHNPQMITHNMPFDIYSIKHSCGPDPYICLNFDFRKVPGEYTEYSIKAQFITDENVEAKATLLMEQYTRTASLYKHNVALIPLGDDFRYNKDPEIGQQYTNYKRLMDYVNGHPEKFAGAQLSWGTPKDYFAEINRRQKHFPTLKGDFFVYSDIFTDGRPAYWSGYFATRPMYKWLSRDLEHNLRAVEILFTVAYNRAHQTRAVNAIRVLEKNYEKLVEARRNLGLFQHHDAITGTSKAAVMRDYGLRLFTSIKETVRMQQAAIEALIVKAQKEEDAEDENNESEAGAGAVPLRGSFVQNELERVEFFRVPRKLPLNVTREKATNFVVYNSVAQERLDVVLIRVTNANVRIFDPEGVEVEHQVNPVWDSDPILQKIRVSTSEFEIMFVAKLPPVSLVTFIIISQSDVENSEAQLKTRMATIYCDDCSGTASIVDARPPVGFDVKGVQPGDIQLENNKIRLLFDEQTGLLKTVTKKDMGRAMQCAIKFGAYRSAQYHSGAYLFKPDLEHELSPEKDVLEEYKEARQIIITSGPVASDVTVLYGDFIAHTVRILSSKTRLDEMAYVENDIDFGQPPRNRDTELFMRLVTDVENGEPPQFYSDANGFQYHLRTKVASIGPEGNYYPITSGAFIQDAKNRVTLLTNHAAGAASLEPGQLEVMIDRRTLYDDARGMGEGVVDSRMTRHRFWLLWESFEGESPVNADEFQMLSWEAHQMANALNYPVNVYFIENSEAVKALTERDQFYKRVELLAHELPCDVHLMTTRTLTEPNMPLFPSRNALMVFFKQGYSCRLTRGGVCKGREKERLSGVEVGTEKSLFRGVRADKLEATSLTGVIGRGRVESVREAVQRLNTNEIKSFHVRFSK